MITHAASRKQYTVLLDRPQGLAFCSSKEAHCKLIISSEMYKKAYIIVENAQDTYIA